jgi:glucosyl-3-phosphoglycerate synthase
MNDLQLGRGKPPTRRSKSRKVLLPAIFSDLAEPLIHLGFALSEGRQVWVLGVVCVEADHSLSEAADQAQDLRTKLRKSVKILGGRLWPKIIVSYQPEYEINSLINEEAVDLMIIPWIRGSIEADSFMRIAMERCISNVAVMHGSPPQPKGKILVVLREGEDSELALRLSLNLARSDEHFITTLRPMGMTEIESDTEATLGIDQVLEYLPQIEDAILVADNPLHAVLEQAVDFDLIVVGASRVNAGDEVFDPFAQQILELAHCPVMITHAHTRLRPSYPAEISGLEAISILVDKWFAENTFRSSEFDNLQALIDRKEKQGLSISLAMPALNEEETVGNVIQTIRSALMDDIPLLDEMVLIDSNSIDNTRKIAQELGIPVYIHQEILPQYGVRQGKGEALWKSLYVTRGDIVLWIDTDIVNIHPRFVYGLIGPLLHRPSLMFIKGFYLRPMKVGKSIQAGGGGRVTELTARPLLNLFYPALSGLVQPLSGEYGGRREALTQVPFSSGYGVEIGLLIDILERFGLDSIGQVDLIKRIHHNQPLVALSMMSFAVIQTLIRKLDRRYGMQLLKDVNRAMKLIRQERGRFFLEIEEIAEHQRPPMSSIPEYQNQLKDVG